MSKVAILLADGFEEIEAVSIIDILRRAEVELSLVAVSELQVQGAQGLKVEADALLKDTAEDLYDMIVLPGGLPGSYVLRDDVPTQEFIKKHYAADKWVTAICAAPLALLSAGVFTKDDKMTSYPAMAEAFEGFDYVEETVVSSGKIITSRGPATAAAFAFALLKALGKADVAQALEEGMLYS